MRKSHAKGPQPKRQRVCVCPESQFDLKPEKYCSHEALHELCYALDTLCGEPAKFGLNVDRGRQG